MSHWILCSWILFSVVAAGETTEERKEVVRKLVGSVS